MKLNMVLSIICFFFLLTLSACTNEEVKYDGEPLKIAVIGDTPELNNEKVYFETISLNEFVEHTVHISTNFNAVMITPVMFEEASKFVEVYNNSKIPIIFFNSKIRSLPLTTEGLPVETARWESLNNISHTTIYFSDHDANREETWYLKLENEKQLDVLYKAIFEKIEML